MSEQIESTLPDEVTIDGRPLATRDAAFQTELDYDGYKDIEEYDNDEYSANMDDQGDDGKELNFSDRPVDENIVEESVVDKQDHRKDEDLK